MKLKALIFSAFLLTSLLPCLGVDRITATVVITNAPTTNGMTFVVATGSTTTRTWTNSVQNSSLQVLTNLTGAGSATNLANNLALNPPIGSVATLSGASNITIYGNAGVPLLITGVGSYFSVTYATQSISQAWTVRVPIAVESDAQKTNVSSGVSGILEHASNTNSIDQNSFAVSELVGLTNAQTLTGEKNFNSTNWIRTAYITNLHVRAGAIINEAWLTNGINYGDAFRSPGSGSQSEQFGLGADASGDTALAIGWGATASGLANSTAIGQTADASGNVSLAVGGIAEASGDDSAAFGNSTTASGNASTAIGNAATASAENATALGQSAEASYDNSTAIGVGAQTQQENQIRLGTATTHVSIPGNLHVLGSSTNNTFRGTNVFGANADVSFVRYALTSLATGNNAAIPIGTNTFVQVSGPGAAFTINGIDGQPNRDGKFLIILNLTGFNMTIAHDSGTDPVAANRIFTMTGADHATTANGCATLIYSASASRWILVNLQE